MAKLLLWGFHVILYFEAHFTEVSFLSFAVELLKNQMMVRDL